MDIVVRLLIGIPILVVLGTIWFFLFNLLTGLVNTLALGAGKGIRAVFRIKGTHQTIGAAALAIAGIGKTLTVAAFSVSVLLYAFLYPTGAVVADASSGVAAAIWLVIWMPAVFVSSLSVSLHDV